MPVTAIPPLLDRSGEPASALWHKSSGIVRLNHGSYGFAPAFVVEHEDRLRAEMNADADGWWRSLSERVAPARESVADWLGAERRATALVTNATAGASVVIASLDLRPNDAVLVTDHAYGAVSLALRRRARAAGARVVVAHVPIAASASDIVDIFRFHLEATPGLRMVLVDQITSPTGMTFPVTDLATLCRNGGVELLIDGAHAPGLLEAPVDDLHGAYWVGNLHKWALTPRGSGVLVADPAMPADRQRLFPPIDSWGNENPYPERFDLQGTLDYSAWLAVPHTLQGIEQRIGWDRYRAYLPSLADAAQTAVAELWNVPLDDLPAHPAPALRLVPLPEGLVTNESQAHRLRDRIAAEADTAVAVTSWNGRGFLRLSAQVYNDLDDYVRFAERWNPRSIVAP